MKFLHVQSRPHKTKVPLRALINLASRLNLALCRLSTVCAKGFFFFIVILKKWYAFNFVACMCSVEGIMFDG